MAIKDILGTVVRLGRGAVATGTDVARGLLGGKRDAEATSRRPTTPAQPAADAAPATAARDVRSPSGSPRTVGAPRAGEPKAPRSATSGAGTDES